MKKLYIEPDFELINIRLTQDVLNTSLATEETLPEPSWSDGDFGDEGFEFE